MGIPPDLDLDGLQVLDATHLFASFDGSGRLGGVDFNADDVLEYDFDANSWEMVYRGAAHHAGWEAADLVAPFAIVAPDTPTPTPTSLPQPTATTTSADTPTHTATPTVPGGTPSTPTATAVSTTTGTPPTATVTAIVTAATATPTATSPTVPPGTCLGDCDGDGKVIINELVTMVNIALDKQPVSRCPAGEGNNDGMILINELIGAVNNALGNC